MAFAAVHEDDTSTSHGSHTAEPPQRLLHLLPAPTDLLARSDEESCSPQQSTDTSNDEERPRTQRKHTYAARRVSRTLK